MFENNLHEVISAYVPHFTEKYDGNLNFDNQRNGRGHQEWKNGDFQKYSGDFLQDSLHGKGKYTWLRSTQSYKYEGGLYASNFEGYANLIRTDGQYFEGLLKNNRRFGPGVVTYPDGKQDVGLWDGPKLRRLSCVIMPEWVPRLARSSNGRVILLKFRKLVPICPVEIDVAKEVLRELGANSEVLQKSDQLYNKCIRHPKSKLFNKKLHDEKFFGQVDCTIEVADLEASLDTFSDISCKNSIVDDIVEILRNADSLKEVTSKQRQETIAKIEEMRQDYCVSANENFVKSLLETLLENTDEMLRYPKEERVLIYNRIMIQNFLQSPKMKNDFPTKKIEVTDLLAWNNEDISIEMMKHIFLCRNMENIVSFRVAKLLAGDRSTFNACGDHEKVCALFLTNCSVGNDEIIDRILLNYDLHHDLCDAKGNAGITFAAARDRWSVIRKLTNVGVNLDVLNDEGLTPLVLCLLRYLAIKKAVGNWESAFLTNTIVKPEERLQVSTEWRPHVSFTDLNEVSVTTLYETYTDLENGLEKLNLLNKPTPFTISECKDMAIDPLKDVYDEIKSIQVDMAFRNFQEPYVYTNGFDTQAYIFKINCETPSTKTKKKESPKNSNSTTEEFIIANKLKVVFTTIKILLSCGANPNIGQAPLPASIICLFCGNEELLNLLLDSSADPNVVTMDENLTPLHILAMLPFSKENADMLRILLEHNADPNCKTNTYHWMEEKTKIIGKYVPTEEDLGKTPLHILCMRYDFNDDTEDFLPQMVKHLIDYKANVSEYYLGHTPFSLAVLRGNLKLIKFFLDTSAVDPNEKLGEGMGVALTVPILKRYANVIPLKTAIDVYDLLMQYCINPLRNIDEEGNAIEFMYREYKSEDEPKIKKTKKDKTSLKKSKASSKKKSSTDEIKNYFLECARKMLHRHVQYNAFKYLTYFILENADLEDEVSDVLVKFLTLPDAERIIQILLRKRIFHPDDMTYFISLQILQRIKSVESQSRKGKTKEDQRTPEDILDNLDFDTVDPINKFGLIEPEVDPNKDRYIVCFYCGRKVGKILIACPKCGLVYFCSEECNKLSIKQQANLHKCHVLFYNREKKKKDEFSALGFKYELLSELDEKLNQIKRDAMLRHLGGEGRGDALDIDFEQDFDLLDFGKRKSARTSSLAQSIRKQGIPPSPWSLPKAGKKRTADERMSKSEKKEKGIRESKSEEDTKRQKFKDMKTPSEENERFKRTGTGDGIEEGAKSKRKYRKATEKDVLSKQQKQSRGKPEEKFKDKTARSEEVPSKESKQGKSKGKIKDRGTWSEKSALDTYKGSKKDKSKERMKGRGALNKKEGLDKRKESIKGKFEGKTKDAGDIQTKKVAFAKGKGKGKGKSEGKMSKKDIEMTTKLDKAKKKGVSNAGPGLLKYGERNLGQEMSVKQKDKFGMKGKLEYGRDAELKIYKSGMQSSLLRLLYRDETDHDGMQTHAYSRLSKKYQHFLEILSQFFPDFDLCMLFLPYACFVDGQLYYRFLDDRPLFCLTYSSV